MVCREVLGMINGILRYASLHSEMTAILRGLLRRAKAYAA